MKKKRPSKFLLRGYAVKRNTPLYLVSANYMKTWKFLDAQITVSTYYAIQLNYMYHGSMWYNSCISVYQLLFVTLSTSVVFGLLRVHVASYLYNYTVMFP